MGAAARPAIPDLIPLLKSDELRPWAVEVLGAIGPDARAAVPAVAEALNDSNPYAAADVGCALLHIDPSQRKTVEARLAAMKDISDFYPRAVLLAPSAAGA